MVSFGFYGKPTSITVEELEILSTMGFEEDGTISHRYIPQNEYFMFLGKRVTTQAAEITEKQILNACKYLDVDRVSRTAKNSILRLRLRANIVAQKGDRVFYFQTKASEIAAENYMENCKGKKVGIYFSRDSRKEKPEGVDDSYIAPGVAYLNTTYGIDSLALFLSELSTWLGYPVKKEYQSLLAFLQKNATKKSITCQALEAIFDRDVMKKVSSLKVFYPIEMEGGYVQLKQQPTAIYR